MLGIWEGVFLLALSSEDTLRNLYLSIAEITCSISGDSDFYCVLDLLSCKLFCLPQCSQGALFFYVLTVYRSLGQ